MNFKYSFLFFFVALLGLTITGCVDQEFDEPPVRALPDIEANITIQGLKDFYADNGSPALLLIEESLVVSGIVTGNDESGNIFKELVFEDETGGMSIALDETGLFTKYPVGTEIFVRLDSLYFGKRAERFQIGADDDGEVGRIAAPLVNTYVVAGAAKEPVVPTPVILEELLGNSQLREELQNRLIVLEGLQFSCAVASGTFAVPGGGTTRNVEVEDCGGNTIVTRLSDFSDFAGTPAPNGNGPLVAIYSVFSNTPQLVIRSDEDFGFAGERCGADCAAEGPISLGEIRDAFNNGANAVLGGSTIDVTVISDRANGNFQGLNLVVQDETGGIVVRFQDDHSFDLGERLQINVANAILGDFNGLVQISNVPVSNAVSQGAGTPIEPRVATIAELLANGDEWESTLIQIPMSMLTGGPAYRDNVIVTDGTGTLRLFTSFGASFANAAIPSSEGTLTAILSDFNGLQLNIRNLDDVDFEGGGGGDPEDITAAELRAIFEDGGSAAPANRLLKGVVISDVDNGNLTGRNLVIQDESGGIVIRFEDEHDFALGESLEINVSNLELSEFNDLLQVNNVPNSSAVSFGPGTLPEPRQTTIAEVLANLEAWESTLVEIEDVEIQDGGTYQGAKDLEDDTGTLTMFTRNDASFASTSVPGGQFTVVGIVSQFSDPQLIIRNLNDIME